MVKTSFYYFLGHYPAAVLLCMRVLCSFTPRGFHVVIFQEGLHVAVVAFLPLPICFISVLHQIIIFHINYDSVFLGKVSPLLHSILMLYSPRLSCFISLWWDICISHTSILCWCLAPSCPSSSFFHTAIIFPLVCNRYTLLSNYVSDLPNWFERDFQLIGQHSPFSHIHNWI